MKYYVIEMLRAYANSLHKKTIQIVIFNMVVLKRERKSRNKGFVA